MSNRFEILENENISEKTPNELWEDIKETILSEAENGIPKKKIMKEVNGYLKKQLKPLRRENWLNVIGSGKNSKR